MYQYKEMIVAGIYNEEGFAEWLQNGKPSTCYIFKRRLDNLIMGQVIHLGMDWSEVNNGLASKPRVDLPEYYEEILEPKEEDIDDSNV